MASKEDVQNFLTSFHSKLSIWGVLFRNRKKNLQTLADLEIRPVQREQFLKELEVVDYSQGPVEDLINYGPDMWIFGVSIKGKEIYIKITMGHENTKTICISFHIGEHPIHYPYKQQA